MGSSLDSAPGQSGRTGPARRLSVSVVVCTKDRSEELATLVQSLIRQDRLPDEIVIVDGGAGTAAEAQLARQIDGQVPLIYLQTPAGLPLQRNRGIAASHGDLVLFLDDDVVLRQDYLHEIAAFLENDREQVFAAAQGAVIDCPRRRDGRPTQDRGWRHSIGLALERVFMLWGPGDGRIKPSGFPSRARGDRPSDLEFMSGCSMCMRRSVFAHVVFDEKLTGYAFMEDVDICRQLLGRGHRAAYWPRARLEHHYTTSARTPSARLGRMMVHNHHYLHCKHSDGSVNGMLAFWWSSIGLVIYAAGKGDLLMGRGIVDGLRDVLSHENPLLRDLR